MADVPKLRADLGIAAPDDLYEALIKAHEGLSQEQSNLLNARLIFLLANHVGDDAVLHEAIAAAREGIA
ncbi:MAG: DUF2783 domain-containing protein [Alphaproteobacteria bacterium]|nr:DUF2783 domain-containing protein [Alphaproteobacteria bacterium]